jgi:hypothetical protein
VGVEVCHHSFVTTVLDGGEWLGSNPGCFTPKESAPGTHSLEGGVDPKPGQCCGEGKKSLAATGS